MIPSGRQRGAASVYFVVIAAALLFGIMVFAVDFGRLYLVQAELQTAADAAALAAATQLVGTANAQTHGEAQVATVFDNTTSNDNRFNLRMNQIGNGAADLVTSIITDYFSSRVDAIANANGGKTGADAKYARVEITAQTPVLFPQFLNPSLVTSRPVVVAAAVAGISSPICTACGVDDLAVVAQDTSDTLNWGFLPGDFYTFYLTASQQTPNITGCLATTTTSTPALTLFDNTDANAIEYVALNHVNSGIPADIDGTLYELGAAPIAQNPDPSLNLPGSIAISPPAESVLTVQDPTTCTGAVTAGADVLCGLDARFGESDPTSNNCSSIPSVDVLSSLFVADSDVAVGVDYQDYPTLYDGSLRRVLTVAVLDDSPDNTPTPNVLGFRQFLIENTPTFAGIDTTQSTGAFVAQYIGFPVPLRCGGVGGVCTVSYGVGRTVLH